MSAWQSIPTTVRAAVWVWTVATFVGVVVGFVAVMAAWLG